MNFQLVLIKPEGFDFVESFREVMEVLQESLVTLGHSACIRTNHIDPHAIPVIFGAHHIAPAAVHQLPPHSIIYNLEQLAPGYPWFSEQYLQTLARFRVWDYSTTNLDYLRKGHSISATHIPFGYSPCLTRIAPADTEDVDVLFFGLQTSRRLSVLRALGERGLNVVALKNVWGAERDAWIARAKLVLNIHQAEMGQFESVRVLFLLANGKAVVSETAPGEQIDASLQDALCAVPYNELVASCCRLASDVDARISLQRKARVAIAADALRALPWIARAVQDLAPTDGSAGPERSDGSAQLPGDDPFVPTDAAESTAADLLKRNEVEAALRATMDSSSELRRRPDLAGARIYLPALDRLVDQIGRRLALAAIDPNMGSASNRSLFIATELYAGGGHTRLLCDIAAHGGSSALVVMTDAFGNAASGKWQGEGVIALLGGVPLTLLPPGSLVEKTVTLKQLMAKLAPARIYLLAHHEDVVAYAACSSGLGIPTLLVHHCDHNPALGTTAEHYIHVDVSRTLHALCSCHLNRPTFHLPLFAPDMGVKNFRYPLQAISTVTSGSPVKFVAEGALAYHGVVADILNETSGRHIHIGALPEAYVGHIRKHLAARGMAPDRFEHIQQVPSLWNALQNLDAHIYVTSFPTGGLRAATEAHGCGYPIACYLPAEDRPFLSHLADYSPATAYWNDTGSLRSALRQLGANHAKAASEARQFYLNNFSESQFTRALSLIEQAS